MVDWALVRFTLTAFITMLVGSQTVHNIYKPLDDLEELIEKEYNRRKQYIEANKQSVMANETK